MRRWVAAGQDPAGFWLITPREAMVILEGADARDKTQLRLSQDTAYTAARLVMFAFNDPKHFPKFDKAFPDPDKKRTPQSPDEIWAAMERWVAVADLIEENQKKGQA